jgi:hypothetical protein
MRNHHDSPQPTGSWTAVALHRFPIPFQPLTLSKAHPKPPLILCVFASLRLSRERGGEAFLSRFSPGTTFRVPSLLDLDPSYRLNGRLYLQKYIFSKPAIHNPLHTLKP